MSAVMPDIGALYLRYGDTMHKVAASLLREAGLESHARDAVQDAIVSIMASPPQNVQNWEAFLVLAVKRKAIDRIRSADARHAGPELDESVHDYVDDRVDVADQVAEAIDCSRRAGFAWDALSVLDDRQRKVVLDITALERSRGDVAAELGVTPGRVSQIMKQALALLEEEMTEQKGKEGHDE